MTGIKEIIKKRSAFLYPTPVTYLNCFELPYDVWIRVSVTKDLKYIVRAGKPSIQALAQAWDNIIEEYKQLSKDVNSDLLFDLRKELECLDKDIIHINTIVNQLAIRRNDELIALLKNEFGFKFKYDDLQKDLAATLTQVKGKRVQLKLKEKEYLDAIKTEGKTDDTEFDYIEELTLLSQFQGVQLRTKDITVAEYVAILNRFKSDQEIKKQQLEKDKNHGR